IAITSRPRTVHGRPNLGYAYLHHAVDDHSRYAYSEILADEKKVNVDNVSFNGCTTNFAATGAGGVFGSLENVFP
ncbi:hypothetical protein ACNI4G_01545, partial [Gordonia amicalis]